MTVVTAIDTHRQFPDIHRQPSTVKKRTIQLRRLAEVWGLYAAFKRPQLSPGTYLRDYQKVERRIEKIRIQSPHIDDAIEIRDWLLRNYAAETARRTLLQLNACCRWATESDLIVRNPFEGLQKQIKIKRPSDKAWAAFSVRERDRIIQEFDAVHPYYAPWVKFLFWSGCRPEEAAGLPWLHVAKDFSELMFSQALPADLPMVLPTKNGKTTRFPCNPRLSNLLRNLHAQSNPQRQELVFQARTGGRFHYTNFQSRYWRPLVTDLVQRGEIAFYLSQYHTRHTWITEALNHLSVADVAYLARVSTQVLYQHYAGRSRGIEIPEF